jgi:hypothetical protein
VFNKALISGMLLAASALGAAELNIDFSQAKEGQTPTGFRSVFAGVGPAGDWRIVLDDVPPLFEPLTPKAATSRKRPVLAQLSRDSTDERFPILIYENETFSDFKLTTRFKLVDGVKEQMAGIAFRFIDEKNFYYIRASGLGNNFNFFKVVNGARSAPIGNPVPVKKGVWHDLSVECRGTQIRALLDGKEVLPLLDDKSHSSGRIGFWTKSDSVSYFADAQITYTPRETLAEILVRDALKKYPRLLGVKIYASITNQNQLRTLASTEQEENGKPAPDEAARVLAERGFFYGKENGVIAMTLPLHDSNGEKVAAVRVLMKSFLGQTEKNALARAMPVVKGMEARIRSVNDLVQ